MIAVLQTGTVLPWTDPLGLPWALLPVGNRPWLEYWIEWCVGRGIRDIRIVLGEGAYEIEQAFGDGARWGVTLTYSFLRDSTDPDSFLRRDPAKWKDGLFYLRRPCFPRRYAPLPVNADGSPPPAGEFCARHGDDLLCCLSPSGAALEHLLDFRTHNAPAFPPDCIAPHPVDSLADYYALNMALVRGEIAHYLTPGYARQENAYLGYNVVYPSAASLKPPLIIGNDCRIRALASVGPDVVLGSRIIVDRQAEVRNSVVLDGTYLGAGIEVDGRIVAGRRLIDPSDGTVLELDDAHLLAQLGVQRRGEGLRSFVHRGLAFVLAALLAPVWLLGTLLGLSRGSRFTATPIVGRRGPVTLPGWTTKSGAPGAMHRSGIEAWPALILVITGDLWLVGQLPVGEREAAERNAWPAYLPGVFGLADLRPDRADLLLRRLEARFYAEHRGIAPDLQLLSRALAGRLGGRTLPPTAAVEEPEPAAG